MAAIIKLRTETSALLPKDKTSALVLRTKVCHIDISRRDCIEEMIKMEYQPVTILFVAISKGKELARLEMIR